MYTDRHGLGNKVGRGLRSAPRSSRSKTARKGLRALPVLLLCLLSIAYCPSSFAQVPLQFNFQGRLTDSNGIPVVGISTGTFNIYKGGTVMGDGTNVFSETWTNLQTDANGVFSATIGSVSNMPLAALADGTTSNRYIEVVINGQTNLPRQQMVSVPYAASVLTLTDWTLFNPMPENLAGSFNTNNYWYRRVGDSMEIRGSTTLGPGGAVTASFVLNLPPGHSFDKSKLKNSGDRFGSAATRNGVNDTSGFYVERYGNSSNQFWIAGTRNDGINGVVNQGFPAGWTAGDQIQIWNVSAPILGW